MATTYEERTAARGLTINSLTWTDIVGPNVLPNGCNSVRVRNDSGADVYFRTDPASQNSQITIHDGETVEVGNPSTAPAGYRFGPTSNPVGSLLSAVSSSGVQILSA